ncbi:MAG: acetyl-CoA carboxylase biotin carboxyl carrier protein [Lentisphaeria bacterium]|jgi:acetyl-CoA carboxylase biotin carboxyl carrier protein|nr:acetyl-CoA carboxylase biotin carboxyl carrier protein [Lentisphaeria bacterium]NLZ60143.1 acetyl-CoA carboxylase biotin carboxyl carrier protein [Lentisphaerota bacterium]
MDSKTVAELAQIMSEHQLTELEVQEQESYIRLSKLNQALPSAASAAPSAAPEPTADSALAADSVDDKASIITAPMPGTFYSSPAPELPAFVKEGEHIGVNTVVCIVEAMKVMNEVKSEISGVVSKVLVQNASPVEFGQPLFEVKLD